MLKLLGAAVAALVVASAGSAGAATVHKGNFLVTDSFAVSAPIEGNLPLKFVLKVTPGVFDYLAVTTDYELGASRYENGQREDYYMGHPTDLIAKFAPGQTGFSSTFMRPRPSCNVYQTGHCLIFWDEQLNITGRLRGIGNGRVSYYLTPVPEPATWALMIAGFGLAGTSLRSARRRLA